MRSVIYYIFFILLALIPRNILADNLYSLSKIGYSQGLSNSAVLSLFRDYKGFMWFGTYDGLNRYDGKEMSVFRTSDGIEKQLLNNTIYQVNAAEPGCLWISTSTGINRLSIIEQKVVESHEIFNDEYKLYANQKGATWLFKRENLYFYDYKKHKFQLVSLPEQFFNHNLPFVDEQGALWLFSFDDNKVFRYMVDSTVVKGPIPKINQVPLHEKRIINTSYQRGILGFVDENKDLFLVDLVRQSKIFIRNVDDLMRKYGTMNGIVSFHGDIILSFMQNGLIKLDSSHRYAESIIDRSLRIFSIYKDPEQDIVWVATDGQGVMAYSRKNSLAKHLMFAEVQNKIDRPVRSIYTDRYGDLWFGTKGDGLIRVPGYERQESELKSLSKALVYFPGTSCPITEYDRGATEYQVFGIVPSRFRDLFWVGSSDAPALSYYDYKKDQLISIQGDYMGVTKIHQIYEQNDTTLWVTSSGKGLQQLTLGEINGTFRVKHSRHIGIFMNHTKIDDYFPMQVEGDSVLWLGSRGMGLVRFSLNTEHYDIYKLGSDKASPVNDILSIHWTGDLLYLGTVAGLVSTHLGETDKQMVNCIDRNKGLINDMIHGVLEDKEGFLWLSTNKGLVKYNPKTKTFHTYYYSNGLKIGEFSDDAFYKSPYTGKLYFGGIDGLLSLNMEKKEEITYQPDVRFYNLIVGVKPVNISHFYNKEVGALVFKGFKPSFTLQFSALDFIEGENYEYSYRLEGADSEEWSAFSSNNFAKFSSLPYGRYTLLVRYKKDALDVVYKSYSMHIHVIRPYYLSVWAIVLYIVVIILLSVYGYALARKYYRREKLVKELIKHELQQSDMHKSIARYHELATTFTNIYRMCGQLCQTPNLPDDFRKMLDMTHEMILSFAFRADGGPDSQSFIDDYMPVYLPVYQELLVKNLSDEVIRMIIYRGKQDLSSLSINIPEGLKVALPQHTLGYIFYFLYMRSLETGETMKVFTSIESARLVIRVSLSDTLANDFLGDHKSNPDAFNGDFSSYLYRWLYTYALRALHAQIEQIEGDMALYIPMLPISSVVHQPNEAKNKKSLLLLEDKSEMVWLVTDLLAEEYSIHCVTTTQQAFNYLKKNSPDVFLADTMIYLDKENRFLEYVESNKGLLMGTVFIPMLTWNAAFLAHRDLSRLVDGFVIMPYNILFLKDIIRFSLHRAMKNPETLVELPGKQEFVCENAEQANFVKKLMQILDENLDKEDLNTTFIAGQMNISLRQYYRKFKEVSMLSSADFIKKYRIERAARLLVESDSSVQEIIESVGIQSRSYFYKEFAARFGCTPKVYQKRMQMGQKSENVKQNK